MQMVYRLMDFLDTAQTADWLRIMTGKPISTTDLMGLCDSSWINPYVRVSGLKGWKVDEFNKNDAVIGFGYQEVLSMEASRESSSPGMLALMLAGVTGVPDPSGNSLTLPCTEISVWEAVVESGWLPFSFKSSDIAALADRLNGMSEIEIAKARAKREGIDLADIQGNPKNQMEHYILIDRFDEDERMGASLEGQLHEQAEIKCVSDATFKAMTVEMRPQNQGEQPDNPDMASTTTLTFPYVTKELKAMHSAALKFWANHTPEKRPPTQKEVGHELCELLGLDRQGNNDPARKAIILAAAIKPDDLQGA